MRYEKVERAASVVLCKSLPHMLLESIVMCNDKTSDDSVFEGINDQSDVI